MRRKWQDVGIDCQGEGHSQVSVKPAVARFCLLSGGSGRSLTCVLTEFAPERPHHVISGLRTNPRARAQTDPQGLSMKHRAQWTLEASKRDDESQSPRAAFKCPRCLQVATSNQSWASLVFVLLMGGEERKKGGAVGVVPRVHDQCYS